MQTSSYVRAINRHTYRNIRIYHATNDNEQTIRREEEIDEIFIEQRYYGMERPDGFLFVFYLSRGRPPSNTCVRARNGNRLNMSRRFVRRLHGRDIVYISYYISEY